MGKIGMGFWSFPFVKASLKKLLKKSSWKRLLYKNLPHKSFSQKLLKKASPKKAPEKAPLIFIQETPKKSKKPSIFPPEKPWKFPRKICKFHRWHTKGPTTKKK
jgi:hypothetical protein